MLLNLPIYHAACPQANCGVENVSLQRRFCESRLVARFSSGSRLGIINDKYSDPLVRGFSQSRVILGSACTLYNQLVELGFKTMHPSLPPSSQVMQQYTIFHCKDSMNPKPSCRDSADISCNSCLGIDITTEA
ncbi:hypothetical protein OIU79_005244 [Salix purpurea]|uniref:Uncharacterized protein n=1 Tax=Salix purpurea TaxID=77065 RepID=A0A9Q0ZAI5_SALPP|nr:hypothetical protein OIU79_005244 [Salix purpurea]